MNTWETIGGIAATIMFVSFFVGFSWVTYRGFSLIVRGLWTVMGWNRPRHRMAEAENRPNCAEAKLDARCDLYKMFKLKMDYAELEAEVVLLRARIKPVPNDRLQRTFADVSKCVPEGRVVNWHTARNANDSGYITLSWKEPPPKIGGSVPYRQKG